MSFLHDVFPGRVAVSPAEAGAAVFGWAEKTAKNRVVLGTFPFPIVDLLGRRVVLLADLETALAGAPTAAKRADPVQLKRSRGRPRKVQGGV